MTENIAWYVGAKLFHVVDSIPTELLALHYIYRVLAGKILA
jgi:hypothetical protein